MYIYQSCTISHIVALGAVDYVALKTNYMYIQQVHTAGDNVTFRKG